VASQLIEEVTAHGQSGSLEDAQEICADGTYFPINLGTTVRRVLVTIVAIEKHSILHILIVCL